MEKKTIANNRKAFYSYAILEKLEAGIVLTGYEVKSLRKSSANLTDGFVNFKKNEAFLENVHIPPYAQQSTHILDFNSRRPRKILMHRIEMRNLFAKTREKGLTLVPLEIYFSPKGRAKVLLGLGKGKKTVDKRETIKKRDVEREMRRDRD
jgi:SsrA-binding protein